MLIRFFLIISIIKNFFTVPFSLNPVTFVRGKSHKRLRIKSKKKNTISLINLLTTSVYTYKFKMTVQKHESTTSDILILNSSQIKC